MDENSVRDSIAEYLIRHGFLVMRINSGRRGNVSFNRWQAQNTDQQTAGIADLVCLSPTGKLYTIETKAVGKKADVSEAQQRFLNEVVKRGGVGIVADCIDDIAVTMRW